MRTLLTLIVAFALLLTAGHAYAQTSTANPQVLCLGSTQPYCVDCLENGGAGSTGSTYVWNVTSGPFAGTISADPAFPGTTNHILINWSTSPSGNYTLQVVETTNGCQGPPVTLNIVISPLLTATVNSTSPICSGNTATFNFTGPANGTISYTLNGTPATIVLNGAGTAVLNIPSATTTQTVSLVSVTDGTCSNPVTGTSTITINSLLTASVSSTSPICNNTTATFTFSGPANGTINYTLNGTPAVANLDATGAFVLTVPNATSAQAVVLTSVSNGSCSNPVTGNSTVNVNPPLVASVSSTSPICNNGTAVFNFSGPNNGSINYTLNGTPGVATLSGSGSFVLSVPSVTANQTVNLVSVSDGTCNNTVTGTSTVNVNPLLTANVNSTSPICNNTTATFTLTGPANGTINYTLNGTPATATLDGTGSFTLTVPNATANQTVNLVSVSDGTCTNPVTGTSTVTVSPPLTASVSSTSPVCSGSTATFNFTGPANGTISYTLNGTPATVTLDGTGNFVLNVPSATTTQTVNLTSVTSGSCSNPVSGTSTITISTLLTASVSSTSPICNNTTATFTFSGPANGTINYTLNGTPAVANLDATGAFVLTVPNTTTTQAVVLTSVSNGSCSNPVTGNSIVNVNPPLVASVSSTSPICNNGTAVFNFSGPNNGSINYTLNGTPGVATLNGTGSFVLSVPSVTSNQTVNLVSVSDGACNNTVTGTSTVNVNPLLTANVNSTSPICNNTTATFTLTGPANGTINYTLNGTPATATLDGTGSFTLTVPNATANQTVNLVSVSDGTCTNPVTGTSTVTVNPPLTAGVSSASPICSGSTATFNFTGPANGTISYTLNGTPATATLDGTGNFVLNVPSATTTQTVNLTSVTSGSCTNTVTGTSTVTINTLLTATVSSTSPVCEGQNAVFTFTGPPGGIVSYTLNGTPATATLDGSGNFTLTVPAASVTQNVSLVSVSNGACSNPVTGTSTVVVNPTPITSNIFHD